MKRIVTILFDEFETLDVFGPVEIFGDLKEYFSIEYYSINGGIVTSTQGVAINTKKIVDINYDKYILLIPGGMGVRQLVNDAHFVQKIKDIAMLAEYVITVCTGSSLLAKTGFLDGKQATSNKKAFAWTKSIAPNVNWVTKARWVRDGNIYSSAGVSAGMDLALGFIKDTLGYDIAKQRSIDIEYNWNQDSSWDPFAEIYDI